jgi:hypothetical protein
MKSGSKPVKQRLRCFNDEKCKAIGEEVIKLISAGFIREVFHPEWLANPVLVKKRNKKWRMCVDYTSLNKVCPKDSFPLPRIDQVVGSTAGCETLCFLDAYSGYHQRAMCIVDQLATSFITPFGAYCYQTMPFRLKNAGAMLTVYNRIKLHMDLQADKSPVVVKGPFFPRVVKPRYRIHGTMCNARIQSSKASKAIF